MAETTNLVHEILERRILQALGERSRQQLPREWLELTTEADPRAAAAALVRLAGTERDDIAGLREEVGKIAQVVEARRSGAKRSAEPLWKRLDELLASLEPKENEGLLDLEVWKQMPAEVRKGLEKLLPRVADRQPIPVSSKFSIEMAQVLMLSQAQHWADEDRQQENQEDRR